MEVPDLRAGISIISVSLSLSLVAMTEHQILEVLKIQPTYARKQVLKILMESPSEEFTIHEICIEKDQRKLSFTKTSVAQAIRLFQARGLIIQSGEKRCPHRGRPILLFRVASGFFLNPGNG